MSTVLIVDDSSIDRKIVGGLLSKSSDLTIQYATNGAEAFAAIQQQLPDVVVTDLVMPEMDGLQLVEAVNKKFPQVPMVLMTSKGNEEIAVKALKSGAASYTPKTALADSILDTVQSLLAISDQRQRDARLLRCLTTTVSNFELANDYNLIPALVGHLQDDATRIGACTDTDRVRIGVALDEALVNAMYHGNLELSSDLRDTDQKQYNQLVQERRSTSPYSNRRIYVEARLSSQEAQFTIRDEGPGFDYRKLPDPRDPGNLDSLGGRGVLLMRTFMDEVVFNDVGNEVTLIKRQGQLQDSSNGLGDA